jgi:hypothetical protein
MSNAEILKELAALQVEQAGIQSRGEALYAQLVCAVCEGNDKVGIRPIMCREPICTHCLELWYDSGIMDPEKMRVESLKKQGRSING